MDRDTDKQIACMNNAYWLEQKGTTKAKRRAKHWRRHEMNWRVKWAIKASRFM